MFVCGGGGGWGDLFFKELAHMNGGNGKSEFYGAGKKARDRPREELMLQLESEGRIPSFLGTYFFFS